MHFRFKNIAVLSLATLMLIKMMGMPIVWLSYNFNKEYIAAELCENKSRPTLHCNGQCILMKKLAKANESNESKENKTEVKSIGVDFIEELKAFSLVSPSKNTPIHNLFKNKLYSSIVRTSIFHPPATPA